MPHLIPLSNNTQAWGSQGELKEAGGNPWTIGSQKKRPPANNLKAKPNKTKLLLSTLPLPPITLSPFHFSLLLSTPSFSAHVSRDPVWSSRHGPSLCVCVYVPLLVSWDPGELVTKIWVFFVFSKVVLFLLRLTINKHLQIKKKSKTAHRYMHAHIPRRTHTPYCACIDGGAGG